MKELNVDFSPKFKRKMGFYSRKGITGTFLAAGGFHGEAVGAQRHMYYQGKGLEFDGYREYTYQDDAKMIDWKATLRANKKLVKLFNEEKNKNIVFLVDASSSMCYGSKNKTKAEFTAELVASLAYSYQMTGDSIGLIMFSDGVKCLRKTSVGEPQWVAMCRELSNPKNYEGKFGFSRICKEIFSLIQGEAVVFLFTDFIGIDDDPGWEKYFEIMSTKYELIVVMVRDIYDNTLPSGIGEVAISNPFNNETISVDTDKIRVAYNERNARFILSMKQFCEMHASDFLMLTTDNDFVKPMMNFLIRREVIWR